MAWSCNIWMLSKNFTVLIFFSYGFQKCSKTVNVLVLKIYGFLRFYGFQNRIRFQSLLNTRSHSVSALGTPSHVHANLERRANLPPWLEPHEKVRFSKPHQNRTTFLRFSNRTKICGFKTAFFFAAVLRFLKPHFYIQFLHMYNFHVHTLFFLYTISFNKI